MNTDIDMGNQEPLPQRIYVDARGDIYDEPDSTTTEYIRATSTAERVVEPPSVKIVTSVLLGNRTVGWDVMASHNPTRMSKGAFEGIDWFRFCPNCGRRLPQYEWRDGKVRLLDPAKGTKG